MQYHIDVDEEFLRVTISGRETDQPPSEVCAAVLAESRKRERIALVHRTPEHQQANHFINLLGRNHGVMVRNFIGVELAKDWLRG